MKASVLVVAEQLRRKVPGGIGRYASALLDGLMVLAADQEVPEVSLLASRPRPAAADPLARWGLPVRTSRLPGPLLTRGWDHGVVRAPAGFDVVHAVSTAAPPIRRSGHGRSGRRRQALVVTVHDTVWRRFPEATTPRGRRWHEAALRRALRRADVLLVTSAEAAGELRAAGAPDGSVSVLRWGTDHLPPPDSAGAQALLRRLGVDGPYLLTASTREPRKNLHRLVAGYRLARPSLPDPWPLVVVGPLGWGADALGSDGGQDGPPPEGVVAAGLVTDEILAGLYRGARAFAYVPLAEGYGLPPLEAMTFGVPVVASTGVPSVVSHAAAPSALRVDPMDADAIGEALVAAAVDESLRTTLSARGRALVAGRTWREAARWHTDLWGSLV